MRVYKQNLRVIVSSSDGTTIERDYPSNGSDYQIKDGIVYLSNKNQAYKEININVSALQNENGDLVGNEAAVRTYLSGFIGGFNSATGGSVATYEEKNDVLTLTVSNTWHVITLPNTPIDKICNIAITEDQDNQNVGCREVGSSLNRVVNIGEDGFGVSGINFDVKTNNSGQIEVFANNITTATFTLLSII